MVLHAINVSQRRYKQGWPRGQLQHRIAVGKPLPQLCELQPLASQLAPCPAF